MEQSTAGSLAAPHKRGQGVKPDLGMFSLGGPFASYTGPALVTGSDGAVLASNAAGQELSHLIETDIPEELDTAIKTALGGRAAQIDALTLPSLANQQRERYVDIVALPWGDGAGTLLLGRDVTLERHLRQAISDSHARYKDLVGLLSGDFAWETDADGRFVFVSPGGGLDHPPAALLHSTAADLVAEGDGAGVFMARAPVTNAALRLRRADGGRADVRAEAVPVLDAAGAWQGARGLCRDVTKEQDSRGELERARQREGVLTAILRVTRDNTDPRRILETVADGLLPLLSADGAAVYRFVDGRFELAATAGGTAPEAELDALLARLEGGAGEAEGSDAEQAVLALATRDANTVNGALCLWHKGRDRPWSEDERVLTAELAAQLGQAIRRILREEELIRLSESDQLTGLPNRRALLAALERHLGGGASGVGGNRKAGYAALLYLDLDHFKLVNDNRGHQAGDDTLMAFARLLRGHARHGDLAARLGGDEFALFLEDIPEAAAVQRAETLASACAAALGGDTADPSRPLAVSIGLAMIPPERTESVSDILARADGAMYDAKQAGHGGVKLAAAPRPPPRARRVRP